MTKKLNCQRWCYSLPEGEHYLNVAYMSPLSRRVEEAGAAALRRLRWPGAIGAEDYFNQADVARERFARLIHAPDPSRIAIVPSVSYGIALAARNVEVRAGQTIVLAEGQFPSNVHAWRSLARERGARVVIVPRPTFGIGRAAAWNARLLEAITTDTAVVALGTVDWTDGTPFDLEAIGQRAREVGAAYVLDGIQSIGVVPFDVERVRPDVLVTSSYKWLGGPTGIGAAYIGERFAHAMPLEETWLGREGSQNFRHLTDYDVDLRASAARFDQGGRAHFVLLPMFIAAVEQLLEWEPAEILDYCRHLTAPLMREAPLLGFAIDEAADRSDHLFAIRLPSSIDASELQRTLASRYHVYVSARGESLRVSPSLHNDPRDVEALLAGLQGAVRRPMAAAGQAYLPCPLPEPGWGDYAK